MPRSVCREMEPTPTLQPTPNNPLPLADEYPIPNAGWAAPLAAGSEIGMLNPATPVEGWVEKLSPIPSMVPGPVGTDIA